jgi:glutamate 5-kinase
MNITNDVNIKSRQHVITNSKRILIKVGSRLLSAAGHMPKQQRIAGLIAQISRIRAQKHEVILVSSGAISTGMELTGMKKRPHQISWLQALASIGQSRLMSLYEQECQPHGFHCGQILLSYDDLHDHKKHLNFRNCLNALLAQGALPVINENDTVSTEEITFGDNDKLAALVATMIHAQLTILLTSVEGLLELNDKEGIRVPLVRAITDDIRSMAQDTDGNPYSTGGMTSKLDAAEICLAAGENLWIADGRDFSILEKILDAEDVGTLFMPSTPRLPGSKRWLAFFSDPVGTVTIDAGAAQALQKSGRSLLPSGITAVAGEFNQGDTINVLNVSGAVIAMGISNYSIGEVDKIKGHKTDRIAAILGRCDYDEVIHRDNMVVY